MDDNNDRYAQGIVDAAKREEAAIFGALDNAFEAAKERVNRHCGEGDGVAFYVLEQVAITLGDAKKMIRCLSRPTPEHKEE